MRYLNLRRVFGAGLILAFNTSASAEIVTFNFTAAQTFNDANPTDAGTAYGGTALTAAGYPIITGSISYDTATVPSTVGTNYAIYPTGTIHIDQFDASIGNFFGPVAVLVSAASNSQIEIAHFGTAGSQLYDDVAFQMYSYTSVLTSDNLPTALGLFDNNGISFFRTDYSNRDREEADFQITSLWSPDAVPEPATWVMMLLGFGGIGYVMRRRKAPTVQIV